MSFWPCHRYVTLKAVIKFHVRDASLFPPNVPLFPLLHINHVWSGGHNAEEMLFDWLFSPLLGVFDASALFALATTVRREEVQ
jgi:hypothetical protein